MKLKTILKKQMAKTLLFSALFLSIPVNATTVQFDTNFGTIDINLYDNDTPLSVANFLQYVNDGDYSNIIFHRAPNPDFILQGGGFDVNLNAINTNSAVNNEPVFSNVRGTIAMAKLGGDPNSATNQWFINITNNSNNLDNQNGGFTVFGQVVNDGMIIVDSIMAVPIFNLGGAFGEIPLQNFTAGTPDQTNLIIVTGVTILDATVDTASGLTRPLTTRAPDTPPAQNSGGGGSLGILLFSLLILPVIRKRNS